LKIRRVFGGASTEMERMRKKKKTRKKKMVEGGGGGKRGEAAWCRGEGSETPKKGEEEIYIRTAKKLPLSRGMKKKKGKIVERTSDHA